MTPESNSNRNRLESWKEIAAFLHREVRTARRWEKARGLPVHRVPGGSSRVYAFQTEIDSWSKGVVELSAAADSEPASPEPPQGRLPRPGILLACLAVLLAIAVLSSLLVLKPSAPQLQHPIALTHDGRLNLALIRGGTSLFYRSIDPADMRSTLERLAEDGGEPYATILPAYGIRPLDATRDGSRVLVREDSSSDCRWPIWEVVAAGGPPHRFGDLCASAAAWSPDERKLAFTTGRDLYLASADGTGSRRLSVLPFASEDDLRWSPDGKRIRIVLQQGPVTHDVSRLWEVTADHGAAKPVLPGWSRINSDQEYSGQWTKDGHFFVFTAVHDGNPGIWAIRDNSRLFTWREPTPILLSTAPEGVSAATLSSDGSKLFAVVKHPVGGELLRFEPGTGHFGPYSQMRSLSAGQLAYSPDGKQVAYMTYPEPKLWISNVDGTNRRPLTTGTQQGALPQWSPEGRRIAYMSWKLSENGPTRIRVVSPDGRDAAEPVQWSGWQGGPQWTSDTELIFGENGPTFPIPASCSIHAFDFKTGKTTELPGTAGLWTARACPAGRYIAAQTNDNRRLILYDRRTAHVTELMRSLEGPLGDNPTWSKDGKSIYMDVPYATDPAIYRIRIADKSVQRIASLRGIQRVTAGTGLWIGLTPDGALLILREIQGSEIYAWDWVER